MVAKTSPFGLKNRFKRSGVFASEDVLRCGAKCGDVVAGAGACSQAQAMTAAQKLEELRHQQRGF